MGMGLDGRGAARGVREEMEGGVVGVAGSGRKGSERFVVREWDGMVLSVDGMGLAAGRRR